MKSRSVTFTFTVEVGPLPDALHNPPQPLEMQDTCEDALGSSVGLQGKGIFSPQGGWGSPIPFDVHGCLRGCQLCYRIQWIGNGMGSSVMNATLPVSAAGMERPMDGSYSNYRDTPAGRVLRGNADDEGFCSLEFLESNE